MRSDYERWVYEVSTFPNPRIEAVAAWCHKESGLIQWEDVKRYYYAVVKKDGLQDLSSPLV